jgi:16S rRNA (uracil1498-N3)-methyltransferase
VCIASAVPGPSRLDDLVTALAELGVATWVPLACERSDRGALDGLARRRDRVARLVREAAQGSGRSRFLDVAEPVTLAEALTRPGGRGAFLLDPDPQAPRLVDLLRSSRDEADMLLLVGPEGGFTEAELQAALGAGVRPASLGACALRTELAAIVAAGIAVASP